KTESVSLRFSWTKDRFAFRSHCWFLSKMSSCSFLHGTAAGIQRSIFRNIARFPASFKSDIFLRERIFPGEYEAMYERHDVIHLIGIRSRRYLENKGARRGGRDRIQIP